MNLLRKALLLQEHSKIMSTRAVLKELDEFRDSPFSAAHLTKITGLKYGDVLRHRGRLGKRSMSLNVDDLDKIASLLDTGLEDERVWELVDNGTSTHAIAYLTGYSIHRVQRANRRYGPCTGCGWGKMKTLTLCESCYQRVRLNNG